jgi:hypothetical protein
MTSDDRLSLILRRLDEIERKLDHVLEELRTPTAIGYSASGAIALTPLEHKWPLSAAMHGLDLL